MRTFLVFFVLVLSLSVTACGNASTPPSAQTQTSSMSEVQIEAHIDEPGTAPHRH